MKTAERKFAMMIRTQDGDKNIRVLNNIVKLFTRRSVPERAMGAECLTLQGSFVPRGHVICIRIV